MKHTKIILIKRKSPILMYPMSKPKEISLFQRSFPKGLSVHREERSHAWKINPLHGKKDSAITVLLTTNSNQCTKTGLANFLVPIRHMMIRTRTQSNHTKTANPVKNGQDDAWLFFTGCVEVNKRIHFSLSSYRRLGLEVASIHPLKSKDDFIGRLSDGQDVLVPPTPQDVATFGGQRLSPLSGRLPLFYCPATDGWGSRSLRSIH